ncbi:lasso peptide biosynthesis B2 protein [Sphingomonas canadensis]|uniref:Lasso peptide biosynthesis B2 protein n=1 Tax=Sphingomonas canadensis TaxID=1219257 RepID=A0ABW3H621_9SPHN|nr:lasso peptide biosynthesis B2 protein [Sphingomonas canadensis]MCW3835023.1 lasso peptide biosynthesis B2 protein [Sphingomonas canadensis]
MIGRARGVAAARLRDPAMDLALRDGLSFCITSGEPVFLDLPADRYFCLGADTRDAFLGLIDGQTDPRAVDTLVELGLLVRRAGYPIAPANVQSPIRSLVEDAGPLRLRHLPRAAYRTTRTAAGLRLRGLPRAVGRIRRRKARIAARAGTASAAEIARAHESLALITASLDKCLWRSLAIAHHLLDRRLSPDLVLGVHLRPFKAHCWVQLGDTLVNDRIETVRAFAPILVV